jgi:uncharacterized membrane protein
MCLKIFAANRVIKMKSKLSVGPVAVFLLVILAQSAYAASFELGVSPSIVSVCPGSSITPQNVQVSIHNLYQYADTYSFTMDTPAGFTSQIQQNVMVNPGETKKLDLFLVNIACSVQPGSYQAVLKAKSGTTGDVITKTLDIDLLNCYEASLSIDTNFKEMCKEETKSVVIYMNVDNRGKYTDTYDLTSSVSWAAFSDKTVTVESGKSKSVALALTPPESLSGLQNINVNVKSQKFYSTDSETIQISIQDCYQMIADLQPMETSVCLGEIVNQKVTISNTGLKADTYTVSVPSWVTADRTSLTVDAKKSAEVSLTLKPSQKGKTYFNVTVSSTKDPTMRKSLPAIVNAQECRGVAVIATPSQSYVCQGVQTDFTVTIKNLGTIQDVFNLSSSMGTLDSNKVVLNPGETKDVRLKIANISTPGTYKVAVKAQAGDVSDTSSTDLVVESCYAASLDISPQSHSVCFGSPVNYTVAVRNTGKLGETYTVTLDSAFGNVTKTMIVGAGQARTEYFNIQVPANPVAGDYPIKAALKSDHVSSSVQTMLSVKSKSSCYSVQVSLKDDAKLVQVCNATTVPVIVKNTGQIKDKYTITAKGADWIYISPDSVELAGGQQQEVYLYLSPTYGVEKKVYEVVVTASSPSSSVDKSIAVGVVSNATGTTAPSGNQTGGTVTPPSGNQTGGGNITGNIILGLDSNTWKVVVVAAITIIIIIILAIRFILLAKK